MKRRRPSTCSLSTVILAVLLIVSMSAAPALDAAASWLAEKTIFQDELASGWENWSWQTTTNWNATTTHSGSKSVSVRYDAGWAGFYLGNAGISSSGYTHLSLWLNGASGSQAIALFLNTSAGQGPRYDIPALTANTWVEVRVPLADLGASSTTITGFTLQNWSDSPQALFYVDDILLISNSDPNGPQLSSGFFQPHAIASGDSSGVMVRTLVTDPQGTADIASVTLDASALGLGILPLYDNGRSNDLAAGDGVYGTVFTAASGTAPGEVMLTVTAHDQAGHTESYPIGALAVLEPPGGAIPSSLPPRLGWGTNAWIGEGAEDWQPNSGVPWDYLYQYITYGWETWGNTFVQRFVNYAWDNGYTPIVTVYLILGTPPNCGESVDCYIDKLQNNAVVNDYLASLTRALQEARGDKPVIFHLDPDFYGYLQQYTNQSPPPAGVVKDDPSSIPVALNKSGYANTMAGFGRYLVDLIHATAPNALAAPHASAWATNSDPHNVTASEAIDQAKRTASFIGAMGGQQADLYFVEWSDRDAGFGLRPWWDDTDLNLPRPSRALLWENALSAAAGKRLILWQVPVGNMAQNNTCEHYQDNRAAYLFRHPSDLVYTGIIGVAFGAGEGCQTKIWTDGGQIAAQGVVAYAAPQAPTGLQLIGLTGGIAQMNWEENTEPDHAGYRLRARMVGTSIEWVYDAGRRNTYSILIPTAAEWEIQVAAYDGQGNLSAYSMPVTAHILQDASLTYLPLIR